MHVLCCNRSPRYKKAPPSGSAVGKSVSIVWQACTRTLTHKRQSKQHNGGQHVALSQYDDLHHSNHHSNSTVTHWLDRYCITASSYTGNVVVFLCFITFDSNALQLLTCYFSVCLFWLHCCIVTYAKGSCMLWWFLL
jgi:hypothetical protein